MKPRDNTKTLSKLMSRMSPLSLVCSYVRRDDSPGFMVAGDCPLKENGRHHHNQVVAAA